MPPRVRRPEPRRCSLLWSKHRPLNTPEARCFPGLGFASQCATQKSRLRRGGGLLRRSYDMRRFGAGWSEEVPGLAIFFVLRSLRLWVDEQRLPVFDFRNGKNVPGVFRENVGDEEVDLVGSVWKFEPVYGCNSIVLALRRFRPY